MKTISIVTHAYNEEDNIEAMYLRIREIMQAYPQYAYEHIFIDNHSTDSTAAILTRIAGDDHHVKLIVNARNFGHIRSPMHALMQARGDVSDRHRLRDRLEPPDLIPQMIEAWEAGYAMVLCVKRSSGEAGLMYWVRKQYYKTVERLSSIETIQNYTGFGLYTREVVDLVRSFNDPYPYFRGIIAEISLPNKRLYFDQPARRRGITKNNFYTLYDIAMLGLISIPRRSRCALAASLPASAVLRLFPDRAGLNTWSSQAVALVDVFGRSCISDGANRHLLPDVDSDGVYGPDRRVCRIGIYTAVQQRPYAVEQERINFEYPPEPPSAA